MQGSLSIERMCQLAGVSRAGFYRSLQEEMPAEEDTEVRSAIQQIAVEHRRRYGYRRISAELRRGGCLLITSVCCGSYAKTTCWPYSRGHSWSNCLNRGVHPKLPNGFLPASSCTEALHRCVAQLSLCHADQCLAVAISFRRMSRYAVPYP